ncbi:protein kinase-like domain, concanavalin A-like lectin/glucanase domain protein [Tanacetum coccineum]
MSAKGIISINKRLKVFVGNFTYECDFVVSEDITSVIDHYLGEVVFGKPFIRKTGFVYDKEKGTVMFEMNNEKITFKMPHKMERFRHIDFEGMKTDSIPPFVIKNDNDHEKTYYLDSLILGPEYKQDESVSKEIRYLMKLKSRAKDEGGVTLTKRHAFWSLNEDILKITVLTTNTSYPSRKIRRIYACTHQRPRKQDPIRRIQERQYAVFKLYGNKIFWKISNVVPTPRNPQYAVSNTLDTPPKTEDKDSFELKGQFLKELRDNTFSGLDHKDANEHIEKVLEIVDLFHIPNITIDQEVVLFYNGLDVATRQIIDSRGAIPSKTAANAKQVNEKVYAAQVGCEQCKGPHYTKDCPLKEEGKTLEEAYYT